mmetsp:Transcript_2026/g.7900  ORF Transcript_2026/g.7900 Transcript_2026/m.7900 type:complete len:313 (+) Transcript_2026:487-1425(+)
MATRRRGPPHASGRRCRAELHGVRHSFPVSAARFLLLVRQMRVLHRPAPGGISHVRHDGDEDTQELRRLAQLGPALELCVGEDEVEDGAGSGDEGAHVDPDEPDPPRKRQHEESDSQCHGVKRGREGGPRSHGLDEGRNRLVRGRPGRELRRPSDHAGVGCHRPLQRRADGDNAPGEAHVLSRGEVGCERLGQGLARSRRPQRKQQVHDHHHHHLRGPPAEVFLDEERRHRADQDVHQPHAEQGQRRRPQKAQQRHGEANPCPVEPGERAQHAQRQRLGRHNGRVAGPASERSAQRADAHHSQLHQHAEKRD